MFWMKVLRMADTGWLLRMIAMRGKGGWLKDLEFCLDLFGWMGVRPEELDRITMTEMEAMLSEIAWRNVKLGWEAGIQKRSKL